MLDRVGFFPTGRSSSGSNNPSIDKAPSLLLLLLAQREREREGGGNASASLVPSSTTTQRTAAL